MRTYLTVLICVWNLWFATHAFASTDLVFAESEEWVEIADLEQVLQGAPESEAVLVILDQQTRLVPGKVSSYLDVAIRIDSAKTMSSMTALFSPVWHPDQGSLTVHRYEIIRGSEVIDLLADDSVFQVIRREKNLERQMVNGRLTAISQIEDLQLRDIVRMRYTVTAENAALADRVQSSGRFLTEDINIDFIRQAVRWPDDMDVQWRVSDDEIVPDRTTANGWTTLQFKYRSKEPEVEIPKNAPQRFKQNPYYEVASFQSWKDVSQVNARLYSKDDGITPGGTLDREIEAIANQTTDKRERMALALRLVQDKVRYLFNGMGYGNYSPQSPQETWGLRYGDCKAKTYLLLAALRRLGIKSEPMLVHTTQRDAVIDKLPSFQAFNHIIVKAELDGQIYWLDGTQNGTRLEDMGDSPTHRYGLPSVKQGAELEEIPIRRPGRPYQMIEVLYDLTAGTDLPAPFQLKATLRDSDAQKLKNAATQYSAEKAKEIREKIALDYVFEGLVLNSEFTYDERSEVGHLRAKGLAYLEWETKFGRRKHELWSPASNFEVQESRDHEELRDLPVRLAYPRYFKYHVTYELPERYRAIELRGRKDVNQEFAGFQVNRSLSKNGSQVVSKEEYHTNRWELPASAFETERQKLALLKRNDLEIVLPEDTPAPWREMEAFKASANILRHRDAFDEHVADAKPDSGDALANRAYFFQTIGEYEHAITDLKAALLIDSSSKNYKWLGDLQLGIDPDGAKASYAKAIEIKPAYFDALLELIRVHVHLEEFDDANLVLKKAKENGLRDASADSLQIEILQAEGKFETALAMMNALVDEKPDSAEYLSDRCLLRAMENKDLDLAMDDCTNMIELAERSSYYHFLRALVYHRQGAHELALVDLDKALNTDSASGYIYALRAETHQKLGNGAMAASDRKSAIYYDKDAAWHWRKFFD